MNHPTPRLQPRSTARSAVRSAASASVSRPITTDASGLTALPCAPGAPLRLHPGYVDLLRQRLHGQRPHFGDPRLERFAQQVFADDLMVECYFQPRQLGVGVQSASGQAARIVVPFEQASQAARSAERMAVLSPYERPLTYLATLIYPCGLFHCAHPAVQQKTGLNSLDGARVRGVSYHLLEWALHNLRWQHQGLADTLSAVLGFGDDGDCDAEQVSRIAAAVTLANLRVTELWTRQTSSTPP